MDSSSLASLSVLSMDLYSVHQAEFKHRIGLQLPPALAWPPYGCFLVPVGHSCPSFFQGVSRQNLLQILRVVTDFQVSTLQPWTLQPPWQHSERNGFMCGIVCQCLPYLMIFRTVIVTQISSLSSRSSRGGAAWGPVWAAQVCRDVRSSVFRVPRQIR